MNVIFFIRWLSSGTTVQCLCKTKFSTTQLLFIISQYAGKSINIFVNQFTHALLGGSVLRPLSQVFREHFKKSGAERRHFWYTCSYIFSERVKISDPRHSRSGLQVTSSDLTSEKFECSSWLHRIVDYIETFSYWYPYKYLQNFCLGILISVTQGQINFATTPL